jgi:hypothetical protein
LKISKSLELRAKFKIGFIGSSVIMGKQVCFGLLGSQKVRQGLQNQTILVLDCLVKASLREINWLEWPGFLWLYSLPSEGNSAINY